MTSFVHAQLSHSQAGAASAEAAVGRPSDPRSYFGSSLGQFAALGAAMLRGLAGMLLIAMVAALLIALNQMRSTLNDGSLLAGWVALWVLVFAGLALFGGQLRAAARRIAGSWRQAAQRRAQEDEYDRMLADARKDPRLMQDLLTAIGRHETLTGEVLDVRWVNQLR